LTSSLAGRGFALDRQNVGQVAAQDRWVLDAVYGEWLDVVLPRVDLVVGLDYPRWFSLQRVFRRSVMRAIDEADLQGNTDVVSRDVGSGFNHPLGERDHCTGSRRGYEDPLTDRRVDIRRTVWGSPRAVVVKARTLDIGRHATVLVRLRRQAPSGKCVATFTPGKDLVPWPQ